MLMKYKIHTTLLMNNKSRSLKYRKYLSSKNYKALTPQVFLKNSEFTTRYGLFLKQLSTVNLSPRLAQTSTKKYNSMKHMKIPVLVKKPLIKDNTSLKNEIYIMLR